MIDSITYRQQYDLNLPIKAQDEGSLIFGDYIYNSHDKIPYQEPIHRLGNIKHGFSIFCDDNKIYSIQASLPRVLFGNNGKLIKSQEDIDTALRILSNEISKIATLSNLIGNFKIFTKIELVLNFEQDTTRFLNIVKEINHPWFKKECKMYDPGSGTVAFYSKSSPRAIEFYDKLKEMKSGSGGNIRAEVRFSTKKMVTEYFSDDGKTPVDYLDFDKCYDVYRNALTQFRMGKSTDTKCTFVNLFALATVKNLKLDSGLSALEWYRESVADRTYKDMLNKVRKNILNYSDWSFNTLLPENELPNVIDIEDDGTFKPYSHSSRTDKNKITKFFTFGRNKYLESNSATFTNISEFFSTLSKE